MAKNEDYNLKDELLDYYERLISFLLQRIGTITEEYDDEAKSKLVSRIALDFANANSKDIDILPDFALQYIRCKKLGIPDDYDAGKYSAHEDGFNFMSYCSDLSEVIGYTNGDDISPIEDEAGIILSDIYNKRGWTPSLRRILK